MGRFMRVMAALTVTALLASCGIEQQPPSVQPVISDVPPAQPASGVSAEPSIEPTVATGETDMQTPFEKHGKLQVHGGQLCDERGEAVQLKGMSTFGLQWREGFWVLNDEAMDALALDWKCDIIRLAMYIAENGYMSNPRMVLDRLEEGIRLASERGLYVLVDWHVLSPGNPNNSGYLSAAKKAKNMPDEFYALMDAHPDWTGPQLFFGYIAQKYGAQGNVLYETANEPNKLGSESDRKQVWSELLKPYHESVITAIREYDTGGIVICGTDSWSQYVDSPIDDPLDDPQVMYSMHFYAGTHDTDSYHLRGMTDAALDAGLAVFCTEWGSSESSGDGGPYLEYATRWLDYLEEKGISWCAWSMSTKNETSAAFNFKTQDKPELNSQGVRAWTGEELTEAGRYYREKIRG